MVGEQLSFYPAATWRLIVNGQADGATNMAVDQAILEALVQGVSPPTLRFYGWSPPCLSLGRNQSLAEIDLKACRGAGVDIVRRPTGGRSILHTDELTYSIALLQTDPRTEGGVVEGYRRLSEGLLSGLRRLGVLAVQAIGSRRTTDDETAVCFETPADYEITVAGRKLVGSAQWRARGGVLQHGALPLSGDLGRIVNYLVLSDAEREIQRERLHRRAITLEDAIGQVLPFEQVGEALAAGMSQALNLTLMPGELTPYESALATNLRDNLYTAPAWTMRQGTPP
jgi:lipoate-protein ligase A